MAQTKLRILILLPVLLF